jgi:hypothetical protein
VKGRTTEGLSDSALVEITPAPDSEAVQAVVLTPAVDTLVPGGTATFTAVGRLADGTAASVDVTYSATGGTISASGLYAAGSQTGTYRVIATAAAVDLADTARITIVPPTLQDVVLTPSSASLAPGGTQQFAASGVFSDGTTEPVSVTFNAAGGTITASGLYTAGSAAGSYRVVATSASGPADTSNVAITVPSGDTGEQAAQADSFVNSIGVNVHLFYSGVYRDNYATVVQPRLSELGVRHLRDHLIKTTDGNWSMWSSRVMELSNLYGAKMLGIADNRYVTPAQAEQVAGLLGSALEAIEGWNEPDRRINYDDATNRQIILDYQADLWNRLAQGSRPVGTPSIDLGTTPPKFGGTWSPGRDFASIHPYPAWPKPPYEGDRLSGYLNWLLPFYPRTAMWVTETGYHTGGSGSDRPITISQHGKWIPRLLLQYFNRGISRSYLYELLDQCPPSTNRECSFGLVYYNGSPKPAFTALKNLIALTKDPGSSFAPGRLAYTLVGAPSSLKHTLLQKRDGRFYLVLWNEVGETSATVPVTLTFPKARRSVEIYRPSQGAAAIRSGTGTTVSLSVPDEVIVVEIAL